MDWVGGAPNPVHAGHTEICQHFGAIEMYMASTGLFATMSIFKSQQINYSVSMSRKYVTHEAGDNNCPYHSGRFKCGLE